MTSRHNAKLTFYSNLGEKVRLNIPRADGTLTEARVRATMEDMITDGIILTTNGTPTGIHSAALVSTTRAPLVNA